MKPYMQLLLNKVIEKDRVTLVNTILYPPRIDHIKWMLKSLEVELAL